MIEAPLIYFIIYFVTGFVLSLIFTRAMRFDLRKKKRPMFTASLFIILTTLIWPLVLVFIGIEDLIWNK